MLLNYIIRSCSVCAPTPRLCAWLTSFRATCALLLHVSNKHLFSVIDSNILQSYCPSRALSENPDILSVFICLATTRFFSTSSFHHIQPYLGIVTSFLYNIYCCICIFHVKSFLERERETQKIMLVNSWNIPRKQLSEIQYNIVQYNPQISIHFFNKPHSP